MANYSTIPHAAVDDGSTPPAHATPWRRLVASALVVSFALGVIGAVAGAPLCVRHETSREPVVVCKLRGSGASITSEHLA